MLRFRGLKSQYLPRGNNTQLFKYLGINWKTSMKFILNLNFLLWKLGQGVHRKPMATHKTVTFVTSNTVLYFTAFTKTTTLFRFLNMNYLMQDWGLIKDSASCELFRQIWIFCNSAAKGFFYRLSFPPHRNFNSTSNS